MIPAPVMKRNAWVRSLLLKTCPFRRASRMRLGVGCSVFSPDMGLLDEEANEVVDVANHFSKVRVELRDQETKSDKDHDQADECLYRLALGVNVNLWSNLPDGAKCNVDHEKNN